ncbi:hypothetical protein M3I54_35900 [Paraburkholderia sp. CNPSo 3274]|uniref:hypothetical protein n=1 Tax=Paraburkholderia sp. CNPSo 3274 TaxID=2940932 RepID=UPI0020B825F8|nr:hypothetical protein [Paraburkholderia sp. CNPSo 3274]MCP3712267.1 hypothetical protein [Paraburkholderia sp. CNPSo 3274]
MSNKKPPVDPSFDPSIPENDSNNKSSSGSLFDPSIPDDGVTLPDDETGISEDLYERHLPSDADIALAAREAFGDKLPEEVLQNLMQTSAEINESVRRIMHEHMNLGFKFGDVIRQVQTNYILTYGNSEKTVERANREAVAYLEKLHRISKGKILLHLKAYARFNENSDAVEFLRLTDMQYLLANDVGDDIVEQIIAKKKEDPEMSTRTVRELIALLRQQRDRIQADKEELASVNDEYAGLMEQFNTATSETNRLKQEIERLRLQQKSTQDATDRLRNELTLSSQSSSALHQQLHDTQEQLDTVRRENLALSARKPDMQDPQVKEDLKRLEDLYDELREKKRELDAEIEEKSERRAQLEAELEEGTAAVEAARRLDEEMTALVKDFSTFAQRYSSAQLLCTADGNPARFKPLFQALGDLVGKFHIEITAAVKAA